MADFLRAQVFLHRERVITAAFDRGVVGYDDRFAPLNDPNTSDDSC
jgi:hypothetical protein